MFTGIIQSIGKVVSTRSSKDGKIIRIHRHRILQTLGNMNSLSVGESIAINGVCLTISKVKQGGSFPLFTTPKKVESRHYRDYLQPQKESNWFEVYASSRTLACTNLSNLRVGNEVNLERALQIGDRIGGHLVQGHIDGVGKVVRRGVSGGSVILSIEPPPECIRYLLLNGSIAIDGVSLTVSGVNDKYFEVSLIPYTLENTTLGRLRIGNLVNLEVDIISKYLVRNKPI